MIEINDRGKKMNEQVEKIISYLSSKNPSLEAIVFQGGKSWENILEQTALEELPIQT